MQLSNSPQSSDPNLAALLFGSGEPSANRPAAPAEGEGAVGFAEVFSDFEAERPAKTPPTSAEEAVFDAWLAMASVPTMAAAVRTAPTTEPAAGEASGAETDNTRQDPVTGFSSAGTSHGIQSPNTGAANFPQAAVSRDSATRAQPAPEAPIAEATETDASKTAAEATEAEPELAQKPVTPSGVLESGSEPYEQITERLGYAARRFPATQSSIERPSDVGPGSKTPDPSEPQTDTAWPASSGSLSRGSTPDTSVLRAFSSDPSLARAAAERIPLSRPPSVPISEGRSLSPAADTSAPTMVALLRGAPSHALSGLSEMTTESSGAASVPPPTGAEVRPMIALPKEAKFAANSEEAVSEPGNVREAFAKSFLGAERKRVTSSAPGFGITSAKSAATMSAEPSTPRSLLHATDTIVSHVDATNEQTSPISATVTETINTAHRAVEAVLTTVDRYSSREHQSVNLQFTVGGTDLRVRVELRADEVKTTFQTESPELQEALAREWQVVTSAPSDRTVRLSAPVFASPEFSLLNSFSGEGQRQRNPEARPAARTAQAAAGASRSGATQVVAEPVDAGLSPLGSLSTALHLHTLA